MELLLPGLSFICALLLVYGIRRVVVPEVRPLTARLEPYSRTSSSSRVASTWSILRPGQRRSSFVGFERWLTKRKFADQLADDLAKSGLPLRVGEYLFIRWGLAVGLGFAAYSFSGIVPSGILGGVLGYFMPRFYLSYRRGQRKRQMEEQLVEALTLMAGSLRVGYSFLQALESVVRESSPPISEEFRLLLEDIAVGAPIEDALSRLSQRNQSEELDIAVTAMLIQRATGGNLAEVLDTLAATIRERLRIRREVQTLTAQERYSSYLVGALPFVMFLLISTMNPEYLDALFGTSLGHVMLAGALFFEALGFVIIRRIMDIEV